MREEHEDLGIWVGLSDPRQRRGLNRGDDGGGLGIKRMN